jgi:hypothetical protein
MNGITEGNTITNGHGVTAEVIKATDSFLICTPVEGGSEFVLNAMTVDGWRNVTDAPAPLKIVRDFVVYDVNGNRVDGYKYESRARRNNDARFAGVGYWLGRASTGEYTFVPA